MGSQSNDEKNMNKESIENVSIIESAPEERLATYHDDNHLLNIIRNPVQLTGNYLHPAKIIWDLDREVAVSNNFIRKGSKLSLDECFEKFTESREGFEIEVALADTQICDNPENDGILIKDVKRER